MKDLGFINTTDNNILTFNMTTFIRYDCFNATADLRDCVDLRDSNNLPFSINYINLMYVYCSIILDHRLDLLMIELKFAEHAEVCFERAEVCP